MTGGASRRARLAASLALILGAMAAGPPGEADGSVHEIEIGTPYSGPSIVALAPDGAVWASLARAGRLLRLGSDGEQREYPLAEGAFPVGLAAAPDGGVWYTDIRHNQIGRLDPDDGAVVTYDVPTPDSWPFFLVLAPDGSLYFTQRVGNKIGHLDPASGRFREFDVPTPHAQPAGLTRTPDGQLFFTQNSANRVGHLDPASGEIRDLPIPSPATPGPYYGPAGIASDREGNVWFAELDGRLGLIRRQARDRIEEIPLPHPEVRPGGVAVDSMGMVWFTGLDGNNVGCFHPEFGSFRFFPIPSGAPDPRPMTPPEVSARGEMPVEGLVARTTRPFGIAAAGDRIWFSEQYGHRLGYVVPPVLDLVSPAGVVSDVVPVRAVWRGSTAGTRLRHRLNDRDVAVDGHFDPSSLSLGEHRWEVVAESADGAVLASAEGRFSFVPSLATVERAASAGGDGAAAGVDTSLARARLIQGRADAAREALRQRLDFLVANRADGGSLGQQIRYLLLFGGLEVPVSVTDQGCRPAEVVVQTGDRVVWENLHDEAMEVVALDGAFRSAAMPFGERWSWTFHREGEITYRCGGETAVVQVRPRPAPLTEFPMPEDGLIPTVLVLDHEGNVWFTAGGGGYASLADVPLNNKIGRLSPDGEVTLYATPTPESAPTSIKMAADGTLWFTLRAAHRIGRLDPRTGEIEEYPVPTPDSAPTGIAVAADGTVWFTEKAAGKVGRFDPRSGEFREYVTPHERSEPSTVVLDDAGYVWFDERGADNLVRLDPASGEMLQFKVPTEGSRVIGLVPDPRGFLWFLELAGQKVGRLEVSSGQIREYQIPTRFAAPFKAALDSHGRLWFTEAYGNKVGVLDGERFFELAMPRDQSMPGGIEIAADGTVWITHQAGNAVARLDAAATIPSSWKEVMTP